MAKSSKNNAKFIASIGNFIKACVTWPLLALRFYFSKIIFLSSADSNSTIFDNMRLFIWGKKDQPIGFNSLSRSTKYHIIFKTLLIMLCHYGGFYLFLRFTSVESIFWTSVVNKKQAEFFGLALVVVAFKVVRGIMDICITVLKTDLIARWRHDLCTVLVNHLNTKINLPHVDAATAQDYPAVIEASLEKYVSSGFNIFINSVNTLMSLMLLFATMSQININIITLVIGAVFVMQSIVGVMNYFFSHLETRKSEKNVALRNALSDLQARAFLNRSLNCANVEDAKVIQASCELQDTARKLFTFRSVQEHIKWRITGIFELVMFYWGAPLYFSGKIAWNHLNLLVNSGVELFSLLGSVLGDSGRINSLNASVQRLKTIEKLNRYNIPESASKVGAQALSLPKGELKIGECNWSVPQAVSFNKEWVLLSSKNNGAGKTTFLKGLSQKDANFCYVPAVEETGKGIKLIDRILYFGDKVTFSCSREVLNKDISDWLTRLKYTSGTIDLNSTKVPSKGQSARIMLIRYLMIFKHSKHCENLPFYAFDEIFQGIDDDTKERLLPDLLSEFKKTSSDKTVFFTSNDSKVLSALNKVCEKNMQISQLQDNGLRKISFI